MPKQGAAGRSLRSGLSADVAATVKTSVVSRSWNAAEYNCVQPGLSASAVGLRPAFSIRLNLFQLEQCGLMTQHGISAVFFSPFIHGREVSGNPPHGSTAAVPALLVGNSLF